MSISWIALIEARACFHITGLSNGKIREAVISNHPTSLTFEWENVVTDTMQTATTERAIFDASLSNVLVKDHPVRDTFNLPGRFWRGNLRTHSKRSDGVLVLEEFCRRYRVKAMIS